MLIDPKPLKEKIYSAIRSKIEESGLQYRLIIVLIGDDLASKKYTNIKKTVGAKLGIDVIILDYKNNIKFDEIDKNLSVYSNDKSFKSGLIFQLPIKEKLWAEILSNNVWNKYGFIDVDLLQKNVTLLDSKGKNLFPPTIGAIFDILDANTAYKPNMIASVIGQGRLVGKHVAKELINRDVTTYSFNEFSKDVDKFCKISDIVITAASTPNLVNYKYINKNGQIIIDASTSEDNNKLIGDLDLISVSNYIDNYKLENRVKICKSPGGIGPITVLKLFYNLVFSVE